MCFCLFSANSNGMMGPASSPPPQGSTPTTNNNLYTSQPSPVMNSMSPMDPALSMKFPMYPGMAPGSGEYKPISLEGNSSDSSMDTSSNEDVPPSYHSNARSERSHLLASSS